MADKKLNKEGFTIIEVVLVLAIAGLIFLMVFVALPALQGSQRDTQRRQDMSRVSNALVQYQTNNSTKSNNLPAEGSWQAPSEINSAGYYPIGECNNSACRFVRDYLNAASANTDENTFKDPEGVPYNVVITMNIYKNGLSTVPSAIGDSKLLVDTNGSITIDNGNKAFKDHVVYIIPGGKCDGESVVKSTVRHFAILYRLETAGTYCLDDQ